MAGTVANIAYAYTLSISLVYTMMYLQNPLLIHDNALVAGLSLLPFSIAVFVFSLGMHWIRLIIPNVMGLLTIGYIAIALNYGILIFLDHSQGYAFWFVPLLLSGIGIGFLQSNISKFAAEALPSERMGEATGIIWTAFYLASMVSIMTCGMIYDHIWHQTLMGQLNAAQVAPSISAPIVNALEHGQRTILYFVHYLPATLSSELAESYRHATIQAMKSIMIVSTFSIIGMALLTLLLHYLAKQK